MYNYWYDRSTHNLRDLEETGTYTAFFLLQQISMMGKVTKVAEYPVKTLTVLQDLQKLKVYTGFLTSDDKS